MYRTYPGTGICCPSPVPFERSISAFNFFEISSLSLSWNLLSKDIEEEYSKFYKEKM